MQIYRSRYAHISLCRIPNQMYLSQINKSMIANAERKVRPQTANLREYKATRTRDRRLTITYNAILHGESSSGRVICCGLIIESQRAIAQRFKVRVGPRNREGADGGYLM